MGFETLALFGVVIFGFMALTQAFRTVREAKKLSRKAGTRRARRLIGSESLAADLAVSLLTDLRAKHPDLSAEAMKSRTIPPELDREIKNALNHYLTRVDSKFKGLFHVTTTRIFLGREDTEK